MSNKLSARCADQKFHIGDLELLNTIRQGRFGKVRLGQHILIATEVGVTDICQQSFFGPSETSPAEVNCMAVLHHPNIVQLFEVWFTQNLLIPRHGVHEWRSHVGLPADPQLHEGE